jgi:alpha-beta hydrolase superfamily lysophospholipase
MISSIEARELFALDSLGIQLRGTYHRARSQVAGPPHTGLFRSSVGILFLNAMSLPRTAAGDSAVYWADAFAEGGYPAFRLDLPGLGDSDGEIPTVLIDFINAGGYRRFLCAAVAEIVERFALSGVVLVGHCAGAVSAIYTAAACKECRGLVLLDPYFYLPQEKPPPTRRGWSGWASWSLIRSRVSEVYGQFNRLRFLGRRNAPPEDANLPLIAYWKELTSADLPILLLHAAGVTPDRSIRNLGEVDYLKHILESAVHNGRVAIELVGGTDHSFANRQGKAGVRQQTEDWLRDHFPLDTEEKAHPVTSSTQDETEKRSDGEGCLPTLSALWKAEVIR